MRASRATVGTVTTYRRPIFCPYESLTLAARNNSAASFRQFCGTYSFLRARIFITNRRTPTVIATRWANGERRQHCSEWHCYSGLDATLRKERSHCYHEDKLENAARKMTSRTKESITDYSTPWYDEEAKKDLLYYPANNPGPSTEKQDHFIGLINLAKGVVCEGDKANIQPRHDEYSHAIEHRRNTRVTTQPLALQRFRNDLGASGELSSSYAEARYEAAVSDSGSNS